MMTGLARQMGMDEKDVREAGLAGIFLDIGKACIPSAILRKPAELTEEEFEVMRSHTERGHELLCRMGITSHNVLDVCLHHHEKMDGSGYPHGLKGDAIGRMARMGAICDVYDAITTTRPYRRSAGVSPAEAIRKMAEWAPEQFDQQIFQAFVKMVGVYPIGSTVLLACGRVGVVVENREQSLLRPRVKVFFSTKSKMRIAPEVIDLAHPSTQNRIVARADPAEYGLTHVDEVWAAEALAALRPRTAATVQ
jgi:HD-GYP domain-containing protein (c-di-GMP phosphodiesterase class II)